KKIFTAFIGFSGCPGGRGGFPFAHSESGGFQGGFQTTLRIRNAPVGVGYCFVPTATAKRSISFPFSRTISRRSPRSTFRRSSAAAGRARKRVVSSRGIRRFTSDPAASGVTAVTRRRDAELLTDGNAAGMMRVLRLSLKAHRKRKTETRDRLHLPRRLRLEDPRRHRQWRRHPARPAALRDRRSVR